jgi:hypothetical protein
MLIPLVAFNDDSEHYRPAETIPIGHQGAPPRHGPEACAVGRPRGGDRSHAAGRRRRGPRHLVLEERRYPPKAILGTAYEFATGERLASGDFEGGKSGAVKLLGELGFTVEQRRTHRQPDLLHRDYSKESSAG